MALAQRMEEEEKFLTKSEFLRQHPEFTDGMTVKSRDGENLGKVIYSGDEYFTLEKGFFFPRDFTLRYDDITDIRNGEVIVRQNMDELRAWKSENYAGWSEVERLNEEVVPEERRAAAPTEETRIPVSEEKVEAEKRLREKGQVKVRKVVHTEMRTVEVPVRKEEVRVERVPVGEKPSEKAKLGEETVTVPVKEEEVEVHKRPVVKEEVRVNKEARVQPEKVSTEVRKEEAKVEREGEIQRRRKAG